MVVVASVMVVVGYARPSCKLLHTTKKDPDSLHYGSSTNTRSKTLMSAQPNVLVETRVPSALRPRYDRAPDFILLYAIPLQRVQGDNLKCAALQDKKLSTNTPWRPATTVR
ncbi:hypothetical protein HZH66_013601 [Vespula vulgaris]|uniref:Uncharacterized protein n=1 Tax=Vespula vulgaris TaxID=7454 RepID=A0A834J836_VESVU|nr:hypothetical protein HZH66_013601 [Vespula vulgaris]